MKADALWTQDQPHAGTHYDHLSEDDSLKTLKLMFPCLVEGVNQQVDCSRLTARVMSLQRSLVSFWTHPGISIRWTASDVDDYALLELPREGSLKFVQSNGQLSAIRPGAALLITCKEWLRESTGYAGTIVRIPRSELLGKLSLLTDTTSILDTVALIKPSGESRALFLNSLRTLQFLYRREVAATGIYDDLLLGAAALFIATYIQQNSNTPDGPMSAIVERARQEILSGLDTTTSVKLLAKRLAVSERYLQLAFQTVVGLGPKQFIIIERLHGAKRDLLTKPDLTISEVSERYGFSSPGHFSTAFKNQFGISPRVARQQDQSGELSTSD